MDRQYTGLAKVTVGVLTFNSGLAIYNSWGDASSVSFVLAADAILLLLFLCLRGVGRGKDAKIKAAVCALTALLTAMVASGVAPLVPLAVGVLVIICVRDVDHQVRGGGGSRVVNMNGEQYCALAKVGLAVVTCNSALDAYYTRRERDLLLLGSASASAALVVLPAVSYTVLVVLTGLFVRGFAARGHAGEQGPQH